GQVGQTNYAAAKTGIIGFTKALALESAPKGITVNAICPGYVDTEMVRAVPEKVRKVIQSRIPVGRFGNPREIAHGVLFLVADDAIFATGSTITVNGGQYMACRVRASRPSPRISRPGPASIRRVRSWASGSSSGAATKCC